MTLGATVAVAISGGVDSAVAAAILKDRYNVIGVSMQLYGEGRVNGARQVCNALDIPLHVVAVEDRFQAEVIDHFVGEYRRGRTPNPCVVCNRRIKFGLLLEEVARMGVSHLATGHYARIDASQGGYRLLKGVDRDKDQSYFLYRLGQTELKHALFPLGEYTKGEARRMAAERGLPTSGQRESQEVCFIPDGSYHSFLAARVPPLPGSVVDTDGNVVGRHEGIARYTIGQRHGLGVASGERCYVVSIDAESNTVVVGPDAALWSDSLLASGVSFVSGEAPQDELEIGARIRYRAPESRALLSRRGELWQVRFQRPQRAIAPGQAVVFYRGEEVLGGGTIESME